MNDEPLSLADALAAKPKKHKHWRDKERTRCKHCAIKVTHDGEAYRHVDEDFSGERKHGHYAEPRRERGASNVQPNNR